VVSEKILESPSIPHRPKLKGFQWPGMAFLFLFPLLALFGIFDDLEHRVEASAGALYMEATYPSRLRLGQAATIKLRIKNFSAEDINGIELPMDWSYLNHFSEIRAHPPLGPDAAGQIGDLAPGAEKELMLRLTPIGNLSGFFRVKAGKNAGPELELKTFVFP
jgi:hypothetical protein